MKNRLLKAGLILHIIYYVLAILSLGNYEYSGEGIGAAFAFWIYAMLISIPCIIVYIIEAIKSIIKKRNFFNVLKLILVIGLVPMLWYIGGSAEILCSIVWNVYFAVIFAMQIKAFIDEIKNRQF